jgi:hypothetical protein
VHHCRRALALGCRAHLDKLLLGFESINPENRKSLGGKAKGLTGDYRRAIQTIHLCRLGVVGLFVFGFDHDTPQTLIDTWDFVRSSELDGLSMTCLTPYPGTPFRTQLVAEGRLLADRSWRHYDTAHVTYQPKLMTVLEMERIYDWFCGQAYGIPSMARRDLRTLGRYPVKDMPRKLFGSFSTDFGYRKTYDWRNVEGDRLLSPWKTTPCETSSV